MKWTFSLCLFIATNCCLAQKFNGIRNHRQLGYGQVAFSVYGNDQFAVIPGISLGGGVLLGNNVTTGAGFDIHMFDRSKLRFSQAYADFRAYFKGIDKAGPYISVQPGVVLLRDQQVMKVKSGFSMSALGGFFVKLDKNMGLTAALGYSLITYSAEGAEKRLNGIKFMTGLCF